MIFLMAPKDIQENSDYERALELLKQEHGEDSVAPDRELFASDKEWKESWKEVYGEADGVYILAREDGTLGLGVWKQWKYLSKLGVPAQVLFEGGGDKSHEAFTLKRLEAKKGEEDLARFALVSL
jgi:hypothetical protein